MNNESMVTQADRDAAASAVIEATDRTLDIRMGDADHLAVVQAFARHQPQEREAVLEQALQKIAAPIGNEPLFGDHDYSPGKQVKFWRKLAIDYRRTAIRALDTAPGSAVSTDEIVAVLEDIKARGLPDRYKSDVELNDRLITILSRLRGEQ